MAQIAAATAEHNSGIFTADDGTVELRGEARLFAVAVILCRPRGPATLNTGSAGCWSWMLLAKACCILKLSFYT